MPYYALTPELSDDYDERTSLTSYRMFYSIVGSMIAFIVPLAVIGVMAPESTDTILAVGIAMGCDQRCTADPGVLRYARAT